MIKKILYKFVVFLPILLILVGTLPAITSIIRPGYFAMHDDLQAMRQLEMDNCFHDLQIPCRWVLDMGYGYGYPLFNYYPPMPYYLGEVIHLLGFSFLDTVKVLFVLVFVLSALTMYLFASQFWGKLGGAVSALFYIWGSYHATDIYVRGAMNESWALVWFPAILWGIYKIIKTEKWKYVVSSSFFIAMLFLSHNPILMVFAPGALLWALFLIWREKKLKSVFKLFIVGAWSFSLAAFFTIPVIFEQKFAHVETLTIGYFNYLAHFVDLNQLFINVNWGYGASELGPNDGMSFHLGYLHWIISFIALAIALFFWTKKKTVSTLIVFFFFWTYGYAFLMHVRSSLIWRTITPLLYLQFPWRMLGLSLLGTSFLAGSVMSIFPKNLKFLKFTLGIVLILAVILINRNFFTWREFYPSMNDQTKFSGKLWELQRTSGIFDYLPIWAQLPPADPANGNAQFLTGKGEYLTEKKVTNFQQFKVKVDSDSAILQINTFYFPGWEAFINGKKVEIDPKKDKDLGRIIIDFKKGDYIIDLKFNETPIRLASDYLSCLAWIVFLGFLFFEFAGMVKKNYRCFIMFKR